MTAYRGMLKSLLLSIEKIKMKLYGNNGPLHDTFDGLIDFSVRLEEWDIVLH